MVCPNCNSNALRDLEYLGAEFKVCKYCGCIIKTKSSEEYDRVVREAELERLKNMPKCPTCASTDLRKISTMSKIADTAMFGLLGTKRHKTFHCNHCGYEW